LKIVPTFLISHLIFELPRDYFYKNNNNNDDDDDDDDDDD